MFLTGIKKELILFSRGFRLWATLLVIIGVALMYPVLYKFMFSMADMLNEMGGVELGDAAASINDMLNSMTALYGSAANIGFTGSITGFTSEGFLIISLMLMLTAGGEQKKRSVVIPNCAGLSPAGYVVPKFAVYPVCVALFIFLGGLFCGFVSNLLYDGGIKTEDMIFSSACCAFYMLFMMSLYFLFGICTGRPGIGVAVLFLGISIIPLLLNAFNINKGTPFALQVMMSAPSAEADMSDFAISIAVTVILSVICCLIALVVTSLRRIDNLSEEEANL